MDQPFPSTPSFSLSENEIRLSVGRLNQLINDGLLELWEAKTTAQNLSLGMQETIAQHYIYLNPGMLDQFPNTGLLKSWEVKPTAQH